MILTVFLSNNEQILTEVPITPETTCRDVVEFCKEPGEGSCHLAEVWRGNGRCAALRLPRTADSKLIQCTVLCLVFSVLCATEAGD